jgi:uncharacterized Zn-binding protein involved in type VI secretion
MGKPAARIGDMHMCPMVTPALVPIPHVGGPIMGPGCPTVLIGKMPAAVLGDMCTCVGPPSTVVLGSFGVFLGGKPAARMGDMTAHGGMITVGCPTVLIGEMSPGATVVIPKIVAIVVAILKKELMIHKAKSQKTEILSDEPKGLNNMLNPSFQKLALMEAAFSGKPFCEMCERMKNQK